MFSRHSLIFMRRRYKKMIMTLLMVPTTLIIFIISLCNAQWQQISEPLLPRGDSCMPCGTYNNSIFFIGGWMSESDVMEYKIATNIMVNHGANVYSPSTHGMEGIAFYYQWNNILYIQKEVDVFYQLDMETNDFWSNWISIPAQAAFNDFVIECVTGNDEYLVMSGGGWYAGEDTSRVEVYVMFLNNNTWIIGTSMGTARRNHGCCFISDFFYVIGGDNTRSIEKINSTQIITPSEPSSQWSALQNDLISQSFKGSIVQYFNDIWVIGGA
eukprot:15634_1